MYRWLKVVVATTLAVGMILPAFVRAETCKLELKRLEMNFSRGRPVYSADNYIYRASSSQGFYMQVGQTKPDPRFSEIVTKEPDYASENPLRAVAKLGSQDFALVMDTKKPEPEPDEDSDEGTESGDRNNPTAGYSQLYFDLNHNGDLTDDGVIEAEGEYRSSAGTYVRNYFPSVDVQIDAGGTRLQYAFTLSVYYRKSTGYEYASASLSPAVYREGEVTLDGKSRRVVLLDFNSNGRFDDETTIRDDISTPEGRIYPMYGDRLLVDPEQSTSGYRSPYDPTTGNDQHYVSKLVNIDGKFYDMEVSAAGDTLTLTASSAPMGKVTNSNDGFRAAVYGDLGFVVLRGDGSEPVDLPAGEWKLLGYTIDQTGYPEEPEEKEDEEESAEEPSLLETLTRAIIGSPPPTTPRPSRPRYTLVSASATKECKSITVREAETVALPFGAPYKPVVKVAYRSGSNVAQLGLNIVGSAGEVCTNLYVDGSRPGKPEFTIVDPEDQEVAQGSFEYG
jgi:hypothetical protein